MQPQDGAQRVRDDIESVGRQAAEGPAQRRTPIVELGVVEVGEGRAQGLASRRA
jgi:hypothetical protein